MLDKTTTSQAILKMEGVSKSFPGVKALSNVGLELFPAEVHALMGENGAGKSTLMKVLGGVHQPCEGSMTLRNHPYSPASPLDARQSRVGFVHQELKLATNMTVAENIFLGRLPTKRFGIVDKARLTELAQQALDQLGVSLSPNQNVGDLNVAMQQMVELAKAISLESEVLIMDEPTASLSERETAYLFKIIRRLREQGTSIVYISHRMEEVFELSDRITVLRDGQSVGTWPTSEITENELIRHMVGREVKDQFPPRQSAAGPVELSVRKLCRRGAFNDVSLEIRQGEVVGVGGLVGAGRTEIARAIRGIDQADSGMVEVLSTGTRESIGYITEDRKGAGLVLGLSIEENVTLPNLKEISSASVINGRKSAEMAIKWVDNLNVRTPGPKQLVQNLSGGNQQKIVIAKWLAKNCRVLIFDEPTRGVDVGARAEIYQIINELAESGVAIMVISSDLPELLGLSDRILVVHEGIIAGEFSKGEATPENIIHCAFTGEKS